MTSVGTSAETAGAATPLRARRDLALICVGTAVSTAGSVLSLFSLSLYLRGHGPVLIAVLLITGILPVVLGAPVVGWLVDRFPNRRILISSQLVQAGLTLGLVTVVDNLPVAMVVLLLNGCANAATMPAASALLPHLTGADGAHRGYARLGAARSTGFLVGASLSGLLLAVAGVRGALLADAATFVLLAGALFLVRGERDPRRPTQSAGGEVRESALGGIRQLRGDAILLASVIGIGVSIVVGVLDNIADIYLVTDALRASVAVYGVVASAWEVGMIAGCWLAGRLRGTFVLVIVIPLASATIGLAMAGAAVSTTVWLVAVAFVIGGLGNGVGNVCWQSLIRVRTPEALRGRVFAACSAIMQAANVTGTVLAGPTVAALGPRLSFGAGGIVTMLVAAGALLVVYRVYQRERRSGPAVEAAVAVAG